MTKPANADFNIKRLIYTYSFESHQLREDMNLGRLSNLHLQGTKQHPRFLTLLILAHILIRQLSSFQVN